MTLNNFFLFVHLQTLLSALIAAISFYRYSERSKLVKLIGVLFAFSFSCNLVGYLIWFFRIEGGVNIPSSIYDGVLVIIASVIYNHLTKSKYKGLFIAIVILFFIAASLNLFLFQKESVASYNKLAGSFIMIAYAIFYFYKLMVELPAVHLHRLPMFWFNSAFLIYHAGAVFLFAFTDYLIYVVKDNMLTYWTFHNLLGILQQLILFVGLGYDIKNLKAATSA